MNSSTTAYFVKCGDLTPFFFCQRFRLVELIRDDYHHLDCSIALSKLFLVKQPLKSPSAGFQYLWDSSAIPAGPVPNCGF
ncbi:hypothetical protein [Desulfosarcina alkanivorans]|uniref:hypothetical protein n=1 Tax=Desulfosarcina alkanivorans TaxID=571177 RepID=UPI0012D35C3C|nr:hypothetical protein [Desulfosarcina alkanivorans]